MVSLLYEPLELNDVTLISLFRICVNVETQRGDGRGVGIGVGSDVGGEVEIGNDG